MNLHANEAATSKTKTSVIYTVKHIHAYRSIKVTVALKFMGWSFPMAN
jgi:hypothetical protein